MSSAFRPTPSASLPQTTASPQERLRATPTYAGAYAIAANGVAAKIDLTTSGDCDTQTNSAMPFMQMKEQMANEECPGVRYKKNEGFM